MMAKNTLNNRPYRPCVGIALFNKDGKVFVGERIDTPGAWQMPQGGIDQGENIKIAALRELKEEIGTNNARLLTILPDTIKYDLPAPLKDTLWNGKYAGQEQTWVAMQFEGKDTDIILDADERPEFSKWQWVKIEETLDLIVPFKRDVYKQVITSLRQT